MSVRWVSFGGMIEDEEADNFRRIQLMSKVEWAEGLITQYRRGIDHYRGKLDKYHVRLGRIEERLGEPEGGDPDDR